MPIVTSPDWAPVTVTPVLPLADLELRWPPALFASEAAALGNAPDAGTQSWQDRVERLLEEAFTGTAAREHMTRTAAAERDPWSPTPAVKGTSPADVLTWLAGAATTFPTQAQPRPYWSQRHAPRPPTVDDSRLSEWFMQTIRDLVDQGYFEHTFPSGCEDDGDDESGVDPSMVLAERLGVPDLWPLDTSRERWTPDTNPDLFYDLVEALHDLVARPRSRSHHSYWRHWHYSDFSTSSGQTLYRWRLNRMFTVAGVDLRLADTGEDIGRLVRVTNDGRQTLFERVLSVAANSGARQHAVALFRGRTADREAKRSAVVALARLLEERRELLKSRLLRKDEGALFQIANEFDLRHNKADQRGEYDEAYLDWIFWWYLATIDLVDQLLARQDSA